MAPRIEIQHGQKTESGAEFCTCPLEPFNLPPDIRLLRACLRGTAPHNSTVRHGCTFCCALQAAQTGWRCSSKGRLVRRAQWLPLLTRPRRCSPALQASISSPSPLMMGVRISQWLPSPAFASPTTTRAQTSGGGRHRGLPRLQCDGSIVTPQNNEALDNQVISSSELLRSLRYQAHSHVEKRR